MRFGRQLGRIGGEDAVGCFDEQHVGVGRIDVAEFVAQRVARDLGQRAGQLDAGGAAADDHEVEQHASPLGDSAAARPLRRP